MKKVRIQKVSSKRLKNLNTFKVELNNVHEQNTLLSLASEIFFFSHSINFNFTMTCLIFFGEDQSNIHKSVYEVNCINVIIINGPSGFRISESSRRCIYSQKLLASGNVSQVDVGYMTDRHASGRRRMIRFRVLMMLHQ